MDEKWFKLQQKKAGVTAEDIAARLGKARSNVSHIYSGKQKMSLDWAQAFAEAFGCTVAEVLERAGAAPVAVTQQLTPGYAESDAIPFVHMGPEDRATPAIAQAFGQREGVDIWRARTSAMALAGYLPGDHLLVDTNAAERLKPGDIVIAEVYEHGRGVAATLLRRFEPPVLIAETTSQEQRRVHVVDGTNVVIKGKVIASWRA